MLGQPLADGNSLVHRLDPRARLVVAAALSLCLALSRSLPAALAGLGLAVLLLGALRPPVGVLCRRLAAINVFLLFLCLLTPFSLPGTTLWHWGPLALSREGLQLALLLWVKSNAIGGILLALVASLPVATAGYALECLHCPARLVYLLLFAGRYVFDIADEWRTLQTAARLRGFRPRCNAHTYRTLASLLGLLLLRGYDRAQRVREAMLLRGFRNHFHTVAVFRFRPADVVFCLLALLGLAALIWLEYEGRP